ncbi:hypothetical protein [Andreesenia angusta]|nr:hypothetical protein [Andreesenia angusta]
MMKEEELKQIISRGFKRGKMDSGFWSYEVELFLVVLKSMVPDRESGTNKVDYVRFQKELELWRDYRHGGNRAVMDAIKGDYESYWKAEDESIAFRVLAIALANESVEGIVEESLKNTAYFTGNSEQIVQSSYMGAFLGHLFNSESPDRIKEFSREAVVKLSLKEDILDAKLLKLELNESRTRYVVEFERSRIELLGKLSGNSTEKYPYVDTLHGLLEGEVDEEETIFEAFTAIKHGKDDADTDRFSEIMARYIWKLRKGWIDPEQIEIKEYIEPDIFSMELGEKSYHSLLNRIELISVEMQDSFEIRHIGTKTGVYRFFKRKNGR